MNTAPAFVEKPTTTASAEPLAFVSDADFLRYWATHTNRAEALAAVHHRSEKLIAESGRGLALTEADLSGLNLSGFDLRRATLNRAQLYGTNLSECDLSEAHLICPGLERANFSRSCLRYAYVHAFAAQVTDFSDADLSGLVDATGSLFHGCKLRRTNLTGAALAGASFYQCDLSNATFDRAAMSGVVLNECHLREVSLDHAKIDQLVITKSYCSGLRLTGATGESVTLQRLTAADHIMGDAARLPFLRIDQVSGEAISFVGAMLKAASITRCVLPGIRFEHADMAEAALRGTTIVEGTLANASLHGASIVRCSLRQSNFSETEIENLQIVESDLTAALFDRAQGRCVTIRDSQCSKTSWRNAYLYRAMITGDPPAGMAVNGADFTNAILVQSYLAASFADGSLDHAALAYGRLNQAIFQRCNLGGAHLFEASCVKTDFTDARITSLEAPVFVDRCPGLERAIETSTPERRQGAILSFLGSLRDVFKKAITRST